MQKYRTRAQVLWTKFVYRVRDFYFDPGEIPQKDTDVVLELRELKKDDDLLSDVIGAENDLPPAIGLDPYRPRNTPPPPNWITSTGERYPWLWQNSVTGVWMLRALKLRSLGLTLAAVVLLFLIPLYLALFLTNTDDGLTFRPSSTVQFGPDMEQLTSQLRSRITGYLKHQPNACGISAANYRVYRRYVVFRHAGAIVEAFNPYYNRTLASKLYTRSEFPTMCRDQQEEPFVAVRASHIVLTYDSPVAGPNQTMCFAASGSRLQSMSSVLLLRCATLVTSSLSMPPSSASKLPTSISGESTSSQSMK